MPTIINVVGLHNQNAESNTDKVWAGVLLEREDGLHQFVSLYGRRGATLRPTYQEPGRPVFSRGSPRDLLDRARRDKLAHGYSVVDWTQARYGMLAAIRNLGTFSPALRERYEAALAERSPNGFRQDNDAERQRLDRAAARQPVDSRPRLTPTQVEDLAAATARVREADERRRREAGRSALGEELERLQEAERQQRLARTPDVEDLQRYITEKTGKAAEPEPTPAPEPQAPAQPWIRKARKRF